MISTRQVKAARAMLAWSQEELASRSGVSYPTIARLEATDGDLGGRSDTADKIRHAMEAAGVIFVAENGEGAGVRLRKGPKAATPGPPQLSTEGKAKRVRARSKAEAVVDAALDKVDATDDEKAFRKRRLTKAPRGLRDK
jgi:transcriptional regulator with XRE-family HTH domain